MVSGPIPQPPAAVFVDAGGVLILPNLAMLNESLRLGASDDALYHAFFRAYAQHDPGRPEYEWLWEAFLTELGMPGDEVHRAATPLRDGTLRPWLDDPMPAPGAIGFLKILEQAGIPTVVVSNSDGSVEKALRSTGVCHVDTGIGAKVTAVVDSHVVGVAKPNPRIFHFARRAVGSATGKAPSLADCVHVGDALWSDVRAADAAGIPVMHLDPEDVCTEQSSHAHVSDLAGVLNSFGLRLPRF